jgi:hypothetical protein
VTPRAQRDGRKWLVCLAAPLLWFAHFSALYGLASFGRDAGANPATFNAIAWTLTAIACIAIGVAWHRSQRLPATAGGPTQGLRTVATWLALLSLAAVLFQTLALAFVPP